MNSDKPMQTISADAAADAVRAYHSRSKHGFGRYAAGPGYLDWEDQPDPFRRFQEAPLISLPLAEDGAGASWADIFAPGRVAPAALNLRSLGALLEWSFGLSAWKEYGGDRWALRCNPSSGNLHPTEAYVVAAGAAELEDGVYHYASRAHALERRCALETPGAGLLIGLSAIHWREAWKYGERAFRYCQHDAGHALGALRYAAAALGWRVRSLDAWGDGDIAALLGLDREADFLEAETEAPDLLCLIETSAETGPTPAIDAWLRAARASAWRGRANRLSDLHKRAWPAIEEVHAAARKPRTASRLPFEPEAMPALAPIFCEASASELIKQRRSAQAFDGVTAIAARAFFRLLDATLPRAGVPPFDAWPWAPRVHLAIFAHRVEGLPPGLYLLCRGQAGEEALRGALRKDFEWSAVAGAPDRFFRLVQANAMRAAKNLSCHQGIAADGAFSLGMLAEFDGVLAAEGAWAYRRLFWECGLIGQSLYLEAEVAGVRGTGIGCFFDDPVHELLGLEDAAFQSLYHFTVGGPLTDLRLRTLPPYAHLDEERRL
jgi:nitroreductase